MRKTRILFILLITFTLSILEQTLSAQKKTQPLNLKISSSKSSLCLGEKITITLSIINKSDKRIAINSSKPWSFISFLTFKKGIGGGGEAENFTMVHGEISHPNYRYLVLNPKQSYETTEVITIDNDFFKINENYDLTVSYQQLQQYTEKGIPLWVGMIDSNKVKLYILACTNKATDRGSKHSRAGS